MNKRYTMKMGLLAAFVLFIAAGFYNPKLVKAAELQNEETAVLQKGDSVVIVTTSDHIYHNINAIFA